MNAQDNNNLSLVGDINERVASHACVREIQSLAGLQLLCLLPDAHFKDKYLRADYKCSVPSSSVVVSDIDHYYPQLRSRGIGCGMIVCLTGCTFEKGIEDVFSQYFERLVSRSLAADMAFGFDVLARKVLKRGKTMLTVGRYGVESSKWWRLAKGGALAYVGERNPKSSEATGFVRETFESSGCHGEPSLDINADHFNSLWVNGSMLGVDDIRIGRMLGGNHFLEAQRVSEIYDAESALRFNIHKDEVTLHAHSCGGMLESCLNYDLVKSYLKQPEYRPIILKDPVRDSFFHAVSLLKNLGSIHRAALCLRLQDTAATIPQLAAMQIRPVLECTHNDVATEEINGNECIVYRHNVHKLDTGSLTVISGRWDHPSYLVMAGPNAHLTCYSVDHGMGVYIDKCRDENVSVNGSVRRLELYGRIFRIIRRRSSALMGAVGEKMLNELERNGIIRMVARLDPIVNLKMVY